MRTKVRIALGLPWYNGPDRDTSANQLVFSHYLGRLQERLYWLSRLALADSISLPAELGIPPLDPINSTGYSEIHESLIGTEFEFAICDETGCSLPGLARERCVDSAIAFGADRILFYDDDMLFGTDAFLRLYLDQKPVVAALAFTGRDPITPVIYRFKHGWNTERACVSVDIQPIWDYERNTLQQVDAAGTGMMMIDLAVFQNLPKPWFHSPGIGEDIYFCYQCGQHGIPVFADTRVKTIHKPTFAVEWMDELKYIKDRAAIQKDHGRKEPDTCHTNIQQPEPVT